MEYIWKNREKGITLIALVITIIILLILAGVGISALTQTGLFEKANQAQQKSKYANALEKIKLATMASYDEKGNLNNEYLKENLNKIDGIKDKITEVSYDLKVIVDGFEFTISKYGTITGDKNKQTLNNDELKLPSNSMELDNLLKEANLQLSLEDILNTPSIMNRTEGLISAVGENEIQRNENADTKEITYTRNNGEIIKSNSEDNNSNGQTWHAFDQNLETTSYSENVGRVDTSSGNYYVEYEFTQNIYAMQIKLFPTNGSSAEGTRKMVIQGYNENTNAWENISDEIVWTGTSTTKEEIVSNLNYTKSYKRYRVNVYSATYTSQPWGIDLSGFYSIQIYGGNASDIKQNNDKNLMSALLKNYDEEITLDKMLSNKEFIKKLINNLSVNTIKNNSKLMSNLPELIPKVSENDVTRIQNTETGEVTYSLKNGNVIKGSSEYYDIGCYLWKAFDRDINTETASNWVGYNNTKSENYFIEYDFSNNVTAMQIKMFPTNLSSYSGTRKMFVQGYNENASTWENISEEIIWEGTKGPEITSDLNCDKSYKKYRIYIHSATSSTSYGLCYSGFQNIQIYGKKEIMQ